MPVSNFPRRRFSDIEQVSVLDGFLGVAADALTAERNNLYTDDFDIVGVRQLDILITVIDPQAATKLSVKMAFTGYKEPLLEEYWAFVMTDNVDTATGISTVQEYVAEIDLTTVNGVATVAGDFPRTYLLRINNISGRKGKLLVWADAPNVSLQFPGVSIMRQGGAM